MRGEGFLTVFFGTVLAGLPAFSQEGKSRTVAARMFKLQYRVVDVSGSVPEHHLWVSTDQGSAWKKAEDAGLSVHWREEGVTLTATVSVSSDGTYGFVAQFGDPYSQRTPEPAPGDKARLVVVVDTQPPALSGISLAEQRVTSQEIKVFYSAVDEGSGVKGSTLWMTMDDGKAWTAVEEAVAGKQNERNFLLYHAKQAGTYGFLVQVTDGAGNHGPAPVSGTLPAVTVTVDVTGLPGYPSAPQVLNPLGGEKWTAGKTVQIRWLSPKGFKDRSATLFYSLDNGPWVVITKGLDPTGFYFWAPPARATENLRLKVAALRADGVSMESSLSGPVALAVIRRPDLELAQKYYHRGVVHRGARQWAEAIHAFEQAMEVWPEYPEAMNELGAVFYEQNEYGRSLEYFLRSREQRRSQAAAYANVAISELKLGLLDDAFDDLRDTIRLGVEHDRRLSITVGEKLWNCAALYLLAHRSERALECAQLMTQVPHADRRSKRMAEDFIKSFESMP